MSAFSSGETASASKFNQKTVFVGTSAPGSPADGQLWYDSTNEVLKEYHLADTSWHKIGADPLEFNLVSDFTTSSTALVDTGITLTTLGPNIFLVTIKIVKTGANNTFTLHFSASAGTAYYIWNVMLDGGNQVSTWASFNADVVGGTTATTYDILLIGYVSAAATVKVQADVQSASDSIAVKAGSSETAYPG